VLAVIIGFRAGFIVTLYGLITWVVAIPVALLLQGPLGAEIARVGLAVPAARTVAFVVVLLLIEALFGMLGGLAIVPFAKRLHAARVFGIVDRVLGVVPSVLRTLVIAAIALAGPDDSAPLFVTKLGADQSQALDLPDGLALVADPEAEQEMLKLVNDERTSRGLPALELDPRLVPIARQHSQEMFTLKYFGHQSPVTGSPFDRLAAAKITYSRAGENLAYAHSVAVAHRGLMDSQGHRENILRPEFTRIGIGVISAGPYGRMFTQLFETP